MKICIVNTTYVDYLRDAADAKVLKNEEDNRTRKYVGVVLTIGGFNYFVPLSSPKPTDYIYKDGIRTIRKSVVPIHRIVVKCGNNLDFFGKLKFSSMIPVPDNEYSLLDVDSIEDKKYKSIIENQIRYIRKNSNILQKKHAEVIYKQKTNNISNAPYLNDTVDFKLLELKCKEYEMQKRIESEYQNK